jgi:hypothetical protein
MKHPFDPNHKLVGGAAHQIDHPEPGQRRSSWGGGLRDLIRHPIRAFIEESVNVFRQLIPNPANWA